MRTSYCLAVIDVTGHREVKAADLARSVFVNRCLVLGDKVLLDRGGHLLVMAEFHAIGALAAGERLQARAVTVEFR